MQFIVYYRHNISGIHISWDIQVSGNHKIMSKLALLRVCEPIFALHMYGGQTNPYT